MPATVEPILKFGLRFKRTDALMLNRLAQRVRSGEIEGEVSTFDQAALAAETGVPLEVLCTDHSEVLQMAAFFVFLGFDQPAIEELNG